MLLASLERRINNTFIFNLQGTSRSLKLLKKSNAYKAYKTESTKMKTGHISSRIKQNQYNGKCTLSSTCDRI